MAIRVGVNILQFCSVSNSLSHINLSNKVRGIFFKEVFARLLSLCLLLCVDMIMYTTVFQCVALFLFCLSMGKLFQLLFLHYKDEPWHSPKSSSFIVYIKKSLYTHTEIDNFISLLIEVYPKRHVALGIDLFSYV